MNYKDFLNQVKTVRAKVAAYAAIPIADRPVPEMRKYRVELMKLLLSEVRDAPENFGRDPAFKALGAARTELTKLSTQRVVYEVR